LVRISERKQTFNTQTREFILNYYAIKFNNKNTQRVETFFVALSDEISSLDEMQRRYENVIDFDIITKEVFEKFTKRKKTI